MSGTRTPTASSAPSAPRFPTARARRKCNRSRCNPSVRRWADLALDSILRLNRTSHDGSTYNNMHVYAFPGERSLTMAWYPEGRLPRHPFPYYRETMTGFEYVVAASLAQRGRFREAEEIVRDIRSRYDGRKRNPFDEAECGHHYVRALAAWSVYKAWKPF